jgi:large subunit ribosomal protein L30
MADKLKVTLVRSTNRRSEDQRRTVKALGLRRIRHSKIHNDTPQIRGMIQKVNHLVDVETVDE